jgi:hypothetical protein
MLLFLLLIVLHLVTSHPLVSNLHSRRNNLTTAIEACAQGTRNIFQDGTNLTQTFQWQIGYLPAIEMPISCKTIMSMDYSSEWQYAVVGVQWKGSVNIIPGTQANVLLRYDTEASSASGVSVQKPGQLSSSHPAVTKADFVIVDFDMDHHWT